MPEAPEVQTIVNDLQKALVGRVFVKIKLDPSARVQKYRDLGKKYLRNQVLRTRIKSVVRRGKNIIINFDTGYSLLTHLLMTGRLLWKSPKDSDPLYLRCTIELDNGVRLCISDISKWVGVKIILTDQISEHKSVARLGTDVLSDSFTLRVLSCALQSSRKIHSLLLDQSRVSGLGNIYVNESLYLAGINPLQPARTINIAQQSKLYQSIKRILVKALKYRGTTFANYRTPSGGKGEYQRFLRVFRRKGLSCKKCGATIIRIKIGGRGAFYCPECQKK